MRQDLPEPLAPLEELARNLWWSWTPEATRLFERLHADRWHAGGHQPLRLLAECPRQILEDLAVDDEYLGELGRVMAQRRASLAAAPETGIGPTAYFSAEFGLHESLKQYSGGLGVLAGDSLKAASDLGLPLVAVGLLYQEGYFQQCVDAHGWQAEEYPARDREAFPGRRVLDGDGQPARLSVRIGARSVAFHVWQLDVGRVPLFLLDAGVEGASEEDRRVTGRLYGGDERLRLEQEVLLGIGGVLALRWLGIEPAGYHMNEGHSALLTLEQIHGLMQQRGLAWEEARTFAADCNVFTTHTPVQAGHDEFESELMRSHLEPMAGALGVPVDELLALGRRPGGDDPRFCMTVLGLRMARHRNGVSRLHGVVSRRMWKSLWEGRGESEVPIDHVTNGVHVATWLSHDLREAYRARLGEDWLAAATGGSTDVDWARVRELDDGELWRLRSAQRERLVPMLRRRMREEGERRGASAEELEAADIALDPQALTLGFCRRFATYKRATLVFRDIERLERLVGADGRPVQLVFAGKAHPKDEPGKRFLQQVVELSRRPALAGRVVFIEGYDLELGRHLIQGVDVWLNTPRRPYEASGTSGMKASLNGTLNLSVLDGWWCEGYHGDDGWAIGDGEELADAGGVQDDSDAESLYTLLETEVVPRFYERGERGVPEGWTRMIKESLARHSGEFSAARMMCEYRDRFYDPARRAAREFVEDTG